MVAALHGGVTIGFLATALSALAILFLLPTGHHGGGTHLFEEERQVTLAAGADGFMRKPVNAEGLYVMLEKHLGIYSERESAVMPHEEKPARNGLTATVLEALSPEARERLTVAMCELNQKKIAEMLLNIQDENLQLAAKIGELSDAMQHRQIWQILGIYDSRNGTGK